MNESLVRHTSKFNFSPSFYSSISCSPPLLSSIEASSLSFLSKALSWWRSSFFHGLFPSGWRLLSPLLLYLPLQLYGGKSPLKNLIEAQRSSLHRSFSSKLISLPVPYITIYVSRVIMPQIESLITASSFLMVKIMGKLVIVST